MRRSGANLVQGWSKMLERPGPCGPGATAGGFAAGKKPRLRPRSPPANTFDWGSGRSPAVVRREVAGSSPRRRRGICPARSAGSSSERRLMRPLRALLTQRRAALEPGPASAAQAIHSHAGGVTSRWMEGPNESSRDDPSTSPFLFICHARIRAIMDRINDIRSAPPDRWKCREHADGPRGQACQSMPIRSRTSRSVCFASFEHCAVPLASASSTSFGFAFSSRARA